MDNTNPIHTLWIGDCLSAMELLTLQSFLDTGFNVILWTYATAINAPSNVEIKDANEIIPKAQIFNYTQANKFGHGKGSFSGFSDIFRYKLLFDKGGIWVDMDITCLQSFSIKAPYFFRFHHHIGLVGNVLKAPKGSPLMEWCFKKAIEVVHADSTNWLLPIEILRAGVEQFQLTQYIQDISNPDSFPLVRELYIHHKTNTANWKVIHWMNEEFRRMQLDKNIAIKDSHYQILLEKHRIPYRTANKEEAQKIIWETSKFSYAVLNLKARYFWYKRKLIQYFKK